VERHEKDQPEVFQLVRMIHDHRYGIRQFHVVIEHFVVGQMWAYAYPGDDRYQWGMS
jgi:hypothetical protein